MTVQQLTVYIENQPGRLYQVTDALGRAGINIRGLNLQEASVSGTLRLIVTDVAKARNVLMALDVPGDVEEVLAVGVKDTPGSLATILRPLFEAQANLRYAYSLLVEGDAVVILCFNDNAAGERVLLEQGIRTLGRRELFGKDAKRGTEE